MISDSVSAEQIIETVKRYGSRVCARMQEADRLDAEQETIAYMLQALWNERAFRSAIWRRLISIATRRQQRLHRACGHALSGGELAREHKPDSGLVVAELYAIACSDDLDTQILKLLTSGNTWTEAAAKLRVDRATLSRRLVKMRSRLDAHGVRLLAGMGVVGSSPTQNNAGKTSPRKTG